MGMRRARFFASLALLNFNRNRGTLKLKLAISALVLSFIFIAAVPQSIAQSVIGSLPEAPLSQRMRAQGWREAGFQTASQQNPSQVQKKKRKYKPPTASGSPGHIFWVIPAFKVSYGEKFTPLTPHEKFQEWAQSAYDPLGLSVGLIEAGTLEYSSKDGYCGYGKGWGGYGKCFGSMELDSNISSFIGDYMLTVAWHQDPRYFRLGRGSFGKRAWYAISRVFVTYNDSGHNVFYSSALTGTVVAAAASNLYYPASEVGVKPTVSRIALDLGNTALYNGAAEFWPDIHTALQHVFR